LQRQNSTIDSREHATRKANEKNGDAKIYLCRYSFVATTSGGKKVRAVKENPLVRVGGWQGGSEKALTGDKSLPP
jgi:hypothetical protein